VTAKTVEQGEPRVRLEASVTSWPSSSLPSSWTTS
jgi:hypothetical protein